MCDKTVNVEFRTSKKLIYVIFDLLLPPFKFERSVKPKEKCFVLWTNEQETWTSKEANLPEKGLKTYRQK